MSTNVKKYNKYLLDSREVIFAPKQKQKIHQATDYSSQTNNQSTKYEKFQEWYEKILIVELDLWKLMLSLLESEKNTSGYWLLRPNKQSINTIWKISRIVWKNFNSRIRFMKVNVKSIGKRKKYIRLLTIEAKQTINQHNLKNFKNHMKKL